MNDRIKELVMKVSPDMVYNNPHCMEEFAKLIIRECARIDSEENNPDHEDGDFNQTIIEHFGLGL